MTRFDARATVSLETLSKRENAQAVVCLTYASVSVKTRHDASDELTNSSTVGTKQCLGISANLQRGIPMLGDPPVVKRKSTGWTKVQEGSDLPSIIPVLIKGLL